MPHPLAIANAAYLEQCIRLLGGLTDDQYIQASPPLSESGVGGHLRHCLDHIRLLLDGCGRGQVDYDARDRDCRVAFDRAAAMAAATRLVERLHALEPETVAAGIMVRMDCGDGRLRDAVWAQSTVARELQFMVSHTTHHYALMAMILRHQGLEPGPDFGVAASTLRHRRAREVLNG